MTRKTATLLAVIGGGLIVIASNYVHHPVISEWLPALVAVGVLLACMGIFGYRDT